MGIPHQSMDKRTPKAKIASDNLNLNFSFHTLKWDIRFPFFPCFKTDLLSLFSISSWAISLLRNLERQNGWGNVTFLFGSFFSLESKTSIKLETFCSNRSKQEEKHVFWLVSCRPRILLNLCFNHWHFMQPSIIKSRVFTQNVSYASNICFVQFSLTVPIHWRSNFIPGEPRPDRFLTTLLCFRKPSSALHHCHARKDWVRYPCCCKLA